MSFFRIFQLIQNNPNRKRDPLLTPRSSRNLNRIGLAWYGSACVVGLLAQRFNLHFESCLSCTRVADWVPSIVVLAQGSYAPDAMRFVLLYHTLSAPIWLILMWTYASNFRRYNMQWWGYPYAVLIFGLCTYTCYFGFPFGGQDARGLFSKSYHDSLLISTMVTTAFWLVFVALTYFFWFYMVGVRFHRWISRKAN